MAKQHLYSRVPARASMFNRTDGFDTFAHSDGLDRVFVERELSAVYENKLSKTDMDAVRQGNMPAVYSQSVLKSGQLVQSCISYLPKDYTGERCAYLCHSLILSETELQVLHSRGNAPLNPQMFIDNASGFDFLSLTTNSAYPEKTYVPCPAGVPAELVQKFQPETLKAFLFAMLSALCAKGKGIYFKLPCCDAEVSKEALKFISSIISVIPYHMRKEISFVTYITDPAQYAHVKVKCISEHCLEPQKNKGIFVDLGTGLVTGMPAGDTVAKAPVNFFYSLLEDAGVRDEFLLFVDSAVKAMPKLESLNMKTLSDLVFLFSGASGLFDSQVILPNDSVVYDFFATYEKYRDALNEEYRRNVYKCLERYPKKHLAIPKNLFSKLSKLYPSDNPSAKRIAVNVVLELVHTDIMRDKLFVFLKNNYNGEAQDIQNMIDIDLCSVFYGGFLQEQILDFFAEHFTNVPENVRDTIFEKLMLSIRTVSVQEKILQFVKEHYSSLTEKEKQQFYSTAYEMIPECDKLTESLISMLNKCLAEETPDYRQQAQMRLSEILEADCKKKEHKLFPMLCANHGFCHEMVIKLVFGPWNKRKIYGEYLELLAQRGVVEKTRELIYIVNNLPDAEETSSKLMLVMNQLYAPNLNTSNVYQWLEAEALITEGLAQRNPTLCYMLCTIITQKEIANRVLDVFDMKLRQDGISVVAQYAEKNYYLTETPKYQIFMLFQRLVAEAEEQRGKSFFLTLEKLLQHPETCSAMADMIFAVYLKWESQDPKTAMLYEMGGHILKNRSLLGGPLYANCKAGYAREIQNKQPKVNYTKISRQAAGLAGEQMLRYLMIACEVSVPVCQAVCRDTEGMQCFIRSFCADYGSGGKKWILSRLHDAPVCLVDAVKTASAREKTQNGYLLSRLFKK